MLSSAGGGGEDYVRDAGRRGGGGVAENDRGPNAKTSSKHHMLKQAKEHVT